MQVTFLQWLKAAGIRALKTVAQTAIATIGTTAVMDQVNWVMVGSASLLAGILSLLTSIAGLPELEQQQYTTLYIPTDEDLEDFHPPADEEK